jgi:hypothetical protein
VTTSTTDLVSTGTPSDIVRARTAASSSLPTYRVNIMRGGYAMMAIGLAIIKWPIILGDVGSRPVYEGVVAALLTAMSLLAFLGLRYPVRLLPLLIFETAWKLIWLAAVGIPHLVAGDLSSTMSSVLLNCSLVVVIIAVTPWDYVWKQYVRSPGDPWR